MFLAQYMVKGAIRSTEQIPIDILLLERFSQRFYSQLDSGSLNFTAR